MNLQRPGDELLLVAHVAWELPVPEDAATTTDENGVGNGESRSGNGANATNRMETSSAKVKIYHQSSSGGIPTVSGRELETRIRARLPHPWCIHHHHHGETNNLIMEIYDPAKSSFISIYSMLDDDNILDRFGPKPKLMVRVSHNTTDDSQESPLAIMGRFYAYTAEEGITLGSINKTLRVHEESNRQNVGTGVNVWDGALLLAHYLDQQPLLVRNKRVLEVGAGCGLVGMAAGVLGARQVLLTDLEYAIPNMQENVDRHADLYDNNYKIDPKAMVCYPLDWTKEITWDRIGESIFGMNERWIPDVILVADCVWVQPLVEPLLSILQQLTPPQDDATIVTKILISYQRRGKSTHEEFWTGIHTRFPNATITEVDVTKVGLSKPDVISLLTLDFGGSKSV